MTCYNCETPTKFTLCSTCCFDPKITISQTDAIKKYKLTHNDLNNNNLFYYQFKTHGNIGTKYLISEIEALAYKLSENLDPYDKRRIAYNKQKSINDKYHGEQNKISENIRQTKQYLKEIMTKYEYDNELINKIIDEDINEQINQIVGIPEEINIVSESLKLITSVCLIAKIKQYQLENKKKLDLLLVDIDKKYVEKCRKTEWYQKCILGTMQLQDSFDRIKKYYDELIAKDIRRSTIDNLITKTFTTKKNIKIVMDDKRYLNYIDKDNTDHIKFINEMVNKFDYEEIIRKRTLKINKKMVGIIDNKYVNMAYNHPSYKNYVKDSSISDKEINGIIDQIKIIVNNKKEQDGRVSSVKKIVTNIQDICNNDIYKHYIETGSNYNNLHTLILTENRIREIDNFINNIIRKSINYNIPFDKIKQQINDIKSTDLYKSYIINSNDRDELKQIIEKEIMNKIKYYHHYRIMNSNNELDIILKDFCNEEYDILELDDYNSSERRHFHEQCNKLDLVHESMTINNDHQNRRLIIRKPNGWKFLE